MQGVHANNSTDINYRDGIVNAASNDDEGKTVEHSENSYDEINVEVEAPTMAGFGDGGDAVKQGHEVNALAFSDCHNFTDSLLKLSEDGLEDGKEDSAFVRDPSIRDDTEDFARKDSLLCFPTGKLPESDKTVPEEVDWFVCMGRHSA